MPNKEYRSEPKDDVHVGSTEYSLSASIKCSTTINASGVNADVHTNIESVPINTETDADPNKENVKNMLACPYMPLSLVSSERSFGPEVKEEINRHVKEETINTVQRIHLVQNNHSKVKGLEFSNQSGNLDYIN